jgi:predicted RNase H-like HicB family nuclease
MVRYLALLRQTGAADYAIDFPDLPGCVAAAPSLEEAATRAGQALTRHLQALIADGEIPPKPSRLDAALVERADPEVIALLVAVQDGDIERALEREAGETALARFIADRLARAGRRSVA